MVCDVCGKPTERIVGKLTFIPAVPGTVRLNWNNYSHAADVGECCKDRIFTVVNFKKRMTMAEYQKSRKARGNRTTVRTRQNGAA